MNELLNLTYNDQIVRTIEIEGQYWWVLSDVCKILDYKNPSMILNRLDEDERAKFDLGHPMGLTNIINESGLYSLILRSDKPEAKPFRKWVTSEVLPQIRKTGKYIEKEKTNIPSKNYNGEKVWLVTDIAKATGIKPATIYYHMRENEGLHETIDYQFLSGEQIQKFKLENQIKSSLSNLYIITECGLMKLLVFLGISTLLPSPVCHLSTKEILEMMKKDIIIIEEQFRTYLENIDRPFADGLILTAKYAAQEFIELSERL